MDEVVVAGQMVNEEVTVDTAKKERWPEMGRCGEEEELGEEQVKVSRRDEKDFMVDMLNMLEFGSYDEAVKRGGHAPATTKWAEGWNADA